jgi:hypothetical protein
MSVVKILKCLKAFMNAILIRNQRRPFYQASCTIPQQCQASCSIVTDDRAIVSGNSQTLLSAEMAFSDSLVGTSVGLDCLVVSIDNIKRSMVIPM